MAKSQLQATIEVLLETASDKNSIVSEAVTTSLQRIAVKYPNEVLNMCCVFCTNKKLTKEHICGILHPMKYICEEYIIQLDGDTVLNLLAFCIDTMTNINNDPLIQFPSSEILVALGKKHCIQIIEGLLKKLETGLLPHHMVLYTLGTLASVNAYGIVPYLKCILEIMLPLMSTVKTELHKQAFSYALENLSNALREYIENVEGAPDHTITLDMFYIDISVAYDILSSSWLQIRDQKVSENVLLAMAATFSVLSIEKVSQQTPRIIPVLLNLYKKQKAALSVTRCLSSVIQVSARVNGTLLEPLLSSILHVLGDFVCIAPDYAQPDLLRNHSEILRCYENISLYFTDHCLDYIISQLKSHNEKDRIRALLILTHLTNSSEIAVQSRITVFLEVLLHLLNDPSIRVKKTLLKTIVAFTYKGFLPKRNEHKYIEFMVTLCCNHKTEKHMDVDSAELLDIQRIADNTLYLLSTSALDLENTLWDLLLLCLLDSKYADACITLLRCLTNLAVRKTNDDSSEAAFIRCIALLAVPLPSLQGTFVLNFMKSMKLLRSETYRPVWDNKILQLMKYLEQNYDNFNEKEWEDLLFDFLSIVIESSKSDEFIRTLIMRVKEQLPMYTNRFAEKRMLLKCLASITCHVQDKQLLTEALDVILECMKLNDGFELQYCAEAIGICSRTHLKPVLQKLDVIRKDVLLKKSTKFFQFNFINNQKNELGLDKVRILLLESYGEICNEARNSMLLQTIEHDILDFAVFELTNCKDFTIRKSCLKTIRCVADAMHPNRNSLHVQMRERNKVLDLVSAQLQLHNGPEYIELYPVILPVLTSLLRLPPALESDHRMTLAKLCFDNVYNASAIYCKINQNNSNLYYGDLKMAPTVYASFSKLNFLVQELLIQNLSPATLDEIVTLLESWLGRRKTEQRLPAIETLRDVLQTYLDHLKFAYEGPMSFGQSGLLLARVVPRCTDPNKNIRKVGVDCLRLIMCIAARYEGHLKDHDKLISQSLQHVQEQIDSDEPKLLFNLTTDIAHVICNNIPQFQLPLCVLHLVDALTDIESSSSSGSSLVLNCIIKNKGSELLQQVSDVLEKLLKSLDLIRCSRTLSSTIRTILALAVHHPKSVTSIILMQPLPYEPLICDCWASFASDATLTQEILEYFKKVFKNSVLYEERQSGDHLRIVTLQPLQVVCAMCEMFKSNQMREICQQEFPHLFSMLFVLLASYINTAAPANIARTADKPEKKYANLLNRDAYKLDPSQVCLETFKLFLVCSGYSRIAEAVVLVSSLKEINQYLDVVPQIVTSLYCLAPHTLTRLITCLAPYSRSELEPQRIAVAAFHAAILQSGSVKQNILDENVLEMLLMTQNDTSAIVKQIGLRGLGFAVTNLNWELVSRHCDNILNIFMQGLDYHNINSELDVTLEAMLSFTKFISVADGYNFNSCQVTAAVRIKPLFEQEKDTLRAAAFHLFGDLALSFGSTKRSDAFKEQVNGSFIALLLHLCDVDSDVVKACKYTLRIVVSFLDCPSVGTMMQNHLLDEGHLHYSEFIVDLVKIMAKEMSDFFPLFIMTCLSYFKSTWVDIRGNAAFLAGLLHSNVDVDKQEHRSTDTVHYRMLQLIKDDQPQVRAKAVQAIAYLYLE